MSKVIITSAKILKAGTEIDYRQIDNTEDKPAVGSFAKENPPKKTFITAMAALTIHGALISELIDGKKIKDPKKITDLEPNIVKQLQRLHVTGFSFQEGKGGREGIKINMTVSTAKGSWGFVAPTIWFDDQTDDPYPFCDEAKAAFKKAQDEAVKYLNGEYQPNPQLSMDLKAEEAK